MGDVFEGISLEDLAGSEDPIMDSNSFTPATPATPKTEDKKDSKADAIENLDGLDLEDLAELEGIAAADDSTEDDDLNSPPQPNKIKTPAKKDDGSSPSSQDTFTSLASALVEAGVFSSLEEEEIKEVTSVEQLLGAMAKQIQNDRYKDLNDNQKKYLEALEHGVPQEEYTERTANAEQYKSLDNDKIKQSPALAKELIRRNFVVKGFSPEDAEKYSTLAIKEASVGYEAIKAKNSLIEFEEKQLQDQINKSKEERTAKIEKEKTALAALKSKVEETSEVLPGIKINSLTKNKIFESMTTPVTMVGDSPRNEVMEAYSKNQEYKLKLHALHVITKGFTDFSKLTKTTTSSAVRTLEEKMNQTGTGKTGSLGAGVQTRTSTGLTLSEIGEEVKKLKF